MLQELREDNKIEIVAKSKKKIKGKIKIRTKGNVTSREKLKNKEDGLNTK